MFQYGMLAVQFFLFIVMFVHCLVVYSVEWAVPRNILLGKLSYFLKFELDRRKVLVSISDRGRGGIIIRAVPDNGCNSAF